jgi:hypothetical protein
MPQFRKKPVVIEAVQFHDFGDHPAVKHALKHRETGAILGTSAPFKVPTRAVFAIETLEGWHEVTPGDWIIKGVKGEFYPCKPDIFEQTYEPA